MTPQQTLEAAGKALYGDQWQSDLARALGIQSRTVRYWVARGSIPVSVWSDLSDLCRDRIPKLVQAMQEIDSLRVSKK